jgi:hypothetical protein
MDSAVQDRKEVVRCWLSFALAIFVLCPAPDFQTHHGQRIVSHAGHPRPGIGEMNETDSKVGLFLPPAERRARGLSSKPETLPMRFPERVSNTGGQSLGPCLTTTKPRLNVWMPTHNGSGRISAGAISGPVTACLSIDEALSFFEGLSLVFQTNGSTGARLTTE